MQDFFDLKNNGTNVKTEVLAGVTTFLSAMYIIAVNPVLLSPSGVPPAAIMTSTVLVSVFATLMMGLYSNNPLLAAPGMSLNLLFLSAVVRTGGLSYQTALGCVFWSGVLFLLLLVLDRRRRFSKALPRMLRYGLAGGIGLFIASLGLLHSGFIINGPEGGLSLGPLNPVLLTFLAGFLFTSVLVVRKVQGAFIWGIAVTAVLSWPIGRWWGDAAYITGGPVQIITWNGWFSRPDFSLLFSFDPIDALRPSRWPFIFVLFFSCFADSLSTCAGVSEAGDLVDEDGEPRELTRSLKANALGIALGGLLGSSPSTVYIESSTGVRAGGRTGLTAVVAGLCFLPFLFTAPLLSLVPGLTTAPVLVLAGVFMLKPLIYVRWERFDEAVPMFMAMILMPLTGSITQGIIWGCLTWTALKAFSGRHRLIPRSLLWIDLMAVFLLAADYFDLN